MNPAKVYDPLPADYPQFLVYSHFGSMTSFVGSRVRATLGLGIEWSEMAEPSQPTRKRAPKSRLDPIDQLREEVWAEYREWLRQTAALALAADERTQTRLRDLADLTARTTTAVADFARAPNERVARLEVAIDALATNMASAYRPNGSNPKILTLIRIPEIPPTPA